ncbi:hypothetical protein RRG08_047275 [Elysia crispata]|uniref:Uncharacterized protein n=1 Tax=Elysia crispata TaxID=231223 RepID=A0AAE0ZE63_9GAST|nr:hypothetical protein RRG08_047275 [Elysia crispata]
MLPSLRRAYGVEVFETMTRKPLSELEELLTQFKWKFARVREGRNKFAAH